MLKLGLTVINVSDIPRAVVFWTGALDLVASGEWRSEDWATLDHRDGSGRTLGLQRSESPTQPHPRLHLDLFVDTAEEQIAEVDWLVGLGARRMDWELYPPEPDFVVLADPDDNPFCVVDLGNAPSGDHREG